MKPKNDIIHLPSIARLHEFLGYEKPRHPLVTVIDTARLQVTPEMIGRRFTTGFYIVSMKSGHCGMRYGRNFYDFEEGVLAFMAPDQVFSPTQESEDPSGWMLVFHPDLIRRSELGRNIDRYSFFSYDTHEALHLSDQEKASLNRCVQLITDEYAQRIDGHTNKVLVSGIELLLDYCLRFYERQFHTRTNQNKDILSRLDAILKAYYQEGQLTLKGSPSVAWCAEQVHLSPNYLSDLLKKETGRNARDHINDFVIDKAKTLLLTSNDTVNEIAYTLGFNYPHYFSRLFKARTGTSPQQYRELN